MIVGPSGENIYPEDIESVLNSHVCVADSVVTEHEGRLVALVHFNTDALEAKFDGWKEDFENWKENLKKEVVDYVNSKVNRFSRISEVVEEKQEFVKTPTQKIRRSSIPSATLTRNTKCPSGRGVYAVMIQVQISVCA